MPYTTVAPSPAVADLTPALHPASTSCWLDEDLDVAWAHVSGELTSAATLRFERMLHDLLSKARLVVLDLRALEFIGTTGLYAIVHAGIRARHSGRRLVVLRAPPAVDRMFAISGASSAVEFGDINQVEPPVQMLLHLKGDPATA